MNLLLNQSLLHLRMSSAHMLHADNRPAAAWLHLPLADAHIREADLWADFAARQQNGARGATRPTTTPSSSPTSKSK